MNNPDYIIVNKTAIQKRIEELEIERDKALLAENQNSVNYYIGQIHALYELISTTTKSTPLIPEIEKSIHFCWFESKKELPHLVNIQSDYASNLKLDI